MTDTEQQCSCNLNGASHTYGDQAFCRAAGLVPAAKRRGWSEAVTAVTASGLLLGGACGAAAASDWRWALYGLAAALLNVVTVAAVNTVRR